MVEIDTDYQEINELFYGEFRILEDAVVEVNTIDGDETKDQGEFARVAGTDGEKYAFSTLSPETVMKKLKTAFEK